MDSYYAGVHKDRLKQEKIIVGTVFDYQFTYGFVLTNQLSRERIRKCIVKGMSVREKYVINLIQHSMSAMPELTEEELAKLSTAMFDPKSPIFQEAVTVIGVMLIVMICLGTLWEFFYNMPRKKRELREMGESGERGEMGDLEVMARKVSGQDVRAYDSLDALMRGQNEELECLMIGEINAFIGAFNRREDDFQQLLRDPTFQEMLPTLMLNKDFRFVQYT